MVYYTVKRGDYLVKIAAAHGTTWQAIWNHPANAELRGRRSGADELYPGDVLAIDSPPSGPPAPDPPSPDPPPPVPPVAPPGPPPAGPLDPPWPYPEPTDEPREPTWDCPTGICICHPSDPLEEREKHVIVLYDALGLRMPMARAHVFEGGRLLDAQQADALGELTVELRPSTQTVQLEWAPHDLPSGPELPYRKRYNVRLGNKATRASLNRLANLGFSRGHSTSARVRHYQRAYHQPETGQLDDVAPEISTRHDRGQVPPFTPFPASPPASAPLASSPQDQRSFDATPATAEELSARSGRRFAARGVGAAPDESPPTGGSAGGPKGSAVPEFGHLEVLARDRDHPDVRHTVAEVVVIVRSVTTGKEVEPSPPEELHGWVWVSFYFLPAGHWEIIVTAPKREARKVVEVATGSSTWTTVELQPLRRRRLSIFDFRSGFVTPDQSLDQPDLAKLEAARLDDYSIVHVIRPKFGTGPVGVEWDPGFEVRRSREDSDRETYLEALVPELHKRGTQFFPGYALVQRRGTRNALAPAFLDMVAVPQGDQNARKKKLDVIDAHAIAILDFFKGMISIDGIAFNIELGGLKPHHTEGVQRLVLQTAKELSKLDPDGVVLYYAPAWVAAPSPHNNQHMSAFTFEFANEHSSLIARPMCFDGTRPFAAGLVIRCADYGLTKTTAAKIQVSIRDRAPPEVAQNVPPTDFSAVVKAMTSRNVGVALMGTRNRMLDRAKDYDANLNPGTEGPGKRGNPEQVPLRKDLT